MAMSFAERQVRNRPAVGKGRVRLRGQVLVRIFPPLSRLTSHTSFIVDLRRVLAALGIYLTKSENQFVAEWCTSHRQRELGDRGSAGSNPGVVQAPSRGPVVFVDDLMSFLWDHTQC